jgi:hypothetical protein
MKSMRRASEATIGYAAILDQPSVRAARQLRDASGPAVASPHKAHRYRADGGATHHGQNDTAGTFHVVGLGLFKDCSGTAECLSPAGDEARRKPTASQDRAARRRLVNRRRKNAT